ncbi:TPA: hypothetical protein SF925_001608 [Staphylococcus aureus]|nr:hypothetical protein [Staphylococcus aureus]HEG8640836.1 hypothetical protein [Staphylococcus aureus]HEG8646145.1 hypothetical protein [Staphylococcus aureus]HEG8649801.1 hypothetical protein [Staphylococcus aureus]HEG8658767.1 hypothetical protein [Staphylococcus aureus]
MNIETIVNQFETRAGTLLRYYTGLLEHSKVQPCCFKLYNDPFDMAYVMMNGKLFGHVYIKDCKVRQSFELASVTFLIASLEYLKENGREFKFKDVTLKYYFNEDELTETQITMIRLLSKQGFILAGDETLQRLIEQDYSSLRYKNAKEDMRKIGISINNQKWIDGVNTKVHQVGNKELFNMALELIND